MKTVILALVVLLVVSQGEALECWCGGTRSCSRRTETCRSSDDVCASVRFENSQISEQTRENMKTVIFALVVLLVVSQGEALTCLCGGRTRCPGRHQTCTGPNQVCAYFAYYFDYGFIQRCNDADDCMEALYYGQATVKCCKTNLCNSGPALDTWGS